MKHDIIELVWQVAFWAIKIFFSHCTAVQSNSRRYQITTRNQLMNHGVIEQLSIFAQLEIWYLALVHN